MNFDGTSLFLLTGQVIPEGGRIRYYWRDSQQAMPKRIALHLDTAEGVHWLSEERKIDWERSVRDNIKAIHSVGDHLFFDYSVGLLPVEKSALLSRAAAN